MFMCFDILLELLNQMPPLLTFVSIPSLPSSHYWSPVEAPTICFIPAFLHSSSLQHTHILSKAFRNHLPIPSPPNPKKNAHPTSSLLPIRPFVGFCRYLWFLLFPRLPRPRTPSNSPHCSPSNRILPHGLSTPCPRPAPRWVVKTTDDSRLHASVENASDGRCILRALNGEAAQAAELRSCGVAGVVWSGGAEVVVGLKTWWRGEWTYVDWHALVWRKGDGWMGIDGG